MEMIRTLFGILAALLALSASSEPQNPDYYTVIPYRPTAVTEVTVTKASEKSNVDKKEDCTSFVMTPQLVKMFFHHARAVSEQARMQQLDWSACYAEGTVVFKNRDAGSWLIARHGVGALTLANGKWKGRTVYFHCAKCEEWDR